MIRVVQRDPSVINVQPRRIWSATKTANQAGFTGFVEPRNPKARQPEGVKQDNRGIVLGRELHSALCKKLRRVAAREQEFGDPLQSDRNEKQNGGSHAALFRETQLAVKPGPIAVNKVRDGKPASMRRSSTKSAVGADMLP